MNAHDTACSRNSNLAKQTSLVLVLLACTFTSCETIRNGLNKITLGAVEASKMVDDTTKAVDGIQQSVDTAKEAAEGAVDSVKEVGR